MDCIFCKIINGEIPSSKVYEDEDFIAFLDINPVHKGHTLLIPKKHFRNLFDTPDDVAAKIYSTAAKVGEGICKATSADGLNILQNNEEAAGQEVFHSHIHIIPRYKEDGLIFSKKHCKYDSFDEMGHLAEAIKGEIK